MNNSLFVKLGLGLGSVAVPAAVAIHRTQQSTWLAEESNRSLREKDLEKQREIHRLDQEVNRYSLLYKKEKDSADSEQWHKNKFKEYSEQLEKELAAEKKSFQDKLHRLEEQQKTLKEDHRNLLKRLSRAQESLGW